MLTLFSFRRLGHCIGCAAFLIFCRPGSRAEQPSSAAAAVPAPIVYPRIALGSPATPVGPEQEAAYQLGWSRGADYRTRGVLLAPAVYLTSFFASLRGEPSLIPDSESLYIGMRMNQQARPGAVDTVLATSLPSSIELAPVTDLSAAYGSPAHVAAHTDGAVFRRLQIPVSPAGFGLGFAHGYAGHPSVLSASAQTRHQADWENLMRTRQAEANAAAALAGKIAADRFIETHPDAVRLPSGVVYRVLKPGAGALADGNDLLQVHYVAHRLDGTVFEDTRQISDAPAGMPVPGMLPGIREILTREPVGTHLIALLPGHTLFGEQWTAELAGNSSLRYDLTIEGITIYPGDTP
jgi:FKBP-type peptidyl-prolyl cis-trans isomerase